MRAVRGAAAAGGHGSAAHGGSAALVALSALFSLGAFAASGPQRGRRASAQEQSRFSAEQGYTGQPVRRPVAVPPAALRALAADGIVSSCMQQEGLRAGSAPQTWFVASRIHLDGPREEDLVILPRVGPRAPAPSVCLLGANIEPFWVLREGPDEYREVLEVDASDLVVLSSRWKGYREIEAYSVVGSGSGISTTVFRFDGREYRAFRGGMRRLR